MDLPTYRKSKGLTVADVARKLGYTHETVRLWDLGASAPRRAAMNDLIDWSDGEITVAAMYALQQSYDARKAA